MLRAVTATSTAAAARPDMASHRDSRRALCSRVSPLYYRVISKISGVW